MMSVGWVNLSPVQSLLVVDRDLQHQFYSTMARLSMHVTFGEYSN